VVCFAVVEQHSRSSVAAPVRRPAMEGATAFDGVTVSLGDQPLKPGQESSANVEDGSDLKTYTGDGRCRRTGLIIAAIALLLCSAGIGAGIAIAVMSSKQSGSSAAGSEWPQASHDHFKWKRSEFFEEFNFTVNLYEHAETGAEVLSIKANDINKAAGIVFRTPVDSNKGIPHMLLHSVLMGSEGYPTQNPPPFWRLEKSSFNTYLNGVLYPDRTMYPVSSPNLQDFYNLFNVYLDGVFHPLVVKDHMLMKKEGWYISLRDASKPETAAIEGVVYNKVANWLAKPSNRLFALVQQSLFPDTTYRFSQQGTLEDIPNLTQADFVEYYEKHYHPSNARFWFYGDDDESERLAVLSEKLEGFGKQDTAATAVHPQEPFSSPQAVEGAFPGSSEDGAFIVSAWMLTARPHGMHNEDVLAMIVLHELLTGSSTSPLRLAMLEHGNGVPFIDLDFGGVSFLPLSRIVGYGIMHRCACHPDLLTCLLASRMTCRLSSANVHCWIPWCQHGGWRGPNRHCP